MSGVPIAPLYGALYFAAVLSVALYGVTCMQTFFYYIHYPNEPARMRSLVAALWILSTAHQALIISGVYKYIVAGLIDPMSFTNLNPELVIQILLTNSVALPTQGFFIYRIYIMSGRNIIAPVLWVPIAIYQLVSALIYVGKALYSSDGVHVNTTATNSTFLKAMTTSCSLVSAGVDVLLAVFLTYLLVRQRNRDPMFKNTAHLLQRLTVLAVNSGIWTATFAVMTAILLLVYPSNMIYSVFGIPLCELYSNTLLANLNSRRYVRGGDETIIDGGGSGGPAGVVAAWPRPGSYASSDEKGKVHDDERGHGGRWKRPESEGSEPGSRASKVQGIWKTTEVVTFSDVDSSGTIRGAMCA